MRILIAEDDSTSARFLAGTLARLGECVIVQDGDEALRVCRAALDEGRPFGLLCLDIMMPGLTGQEVLAALRHCEKEMGLAPTACAKVVMTTAVGDIGSVMAAYKAGATAYLTKPIMTDRLLETIRCLGLDI